MITASYLDSPVKIFVLLVVGILSLLIGGELASQLTGRDYFRVPIFKRLKGFFSRLKSTRSNSSTSFQSAQYHNVKWFMVILGAVLGTRFIIFLLGFMGVMLRNETISFYDSLQSIWNQWDALRYLQIAKYGYTYTDPTDLNPIVFFPLYPTLIKLLTLIIGDHFLSGIVISNLSLIIAAYYLFRLVKLDFDHATALRSVKFFLLYPFSFFLSIVYTEGLFMALTLSGFYYMRRHNWLLVGILGLLASLTRAFGLLLIIPALIEFLISLNIGELLKKHQYTQIIQTLLVQGTYLSLIPLGFGVYLVLNQVTNGHWFAFINAHKQFYASSFDLFSSNYLSIVGRALTDQTMFRASYWLPQVIIGFLAIVSMFYGLRKIRPSYLMYMLASLVIIFSPTLLLSGSRYILSLFPLYISFALAARNNLINNFLTLISTGMLCFYTLAYSVHHLVM